MSDENCCQSVTYSKVTLKDPGSPIKATILNDSSRQLKRCRVDNCLVKDGKKCDFLVQEVGAWSLFVELKGRHLSEAVEQFTHTLSDKNVKKLISGQVGLLAVCSKVKAPNVSSYLLKSKQKFARDFSAKFHAKSGSAEFCPYQLTGALRS